MLHLSRKVKGLSGTFFIGGSDIARGLPWISWFSTLRNQGPVFYKETTITQKKLTIMEVCNQVIQILDEVLQLGSRARDLTAESPLLGAIPEFDSMAVVSVLTSLEEEYDFYAEDDEIDASIFETVGSLADFVEAQMNA